MQPGDWPRGHSPLARPGEGKVPTDLLGFCPNPGKVMLGGRSGWMGKGRLGEGPQEKVEGPPARWRTTGEVSLGMDHLPPLPPPNEGGLVEAAKDKASGFGRLQLGEGRPFSGGTRAWVGELLRGRFLHQASQQGGSGVRGPGFAPSLDLG